MTDFVNQLVELVRHAPSWLSATILFGASCIEYIFPPFPGDTILIAGGFFAARGVISFEITFLSLIIGSVVGCTIAWTLGRFFGSRLLSHKNIESIEKNYARFGNWILIFNRFIPGIRGVFMIASGVAKISITKVLLFGTLSSLLWNSLLIGIGYFFSTNLESLLQLTQQYSTVVLILATVFIMVWLMKSFWPLSVFLCIFSISSCECSPKKLPPKTVNFTESYTLNSHYNLEDKTLNLEVILQDGVHAYGPGETVGKPVELIIENTNGWHLESSPIYPKGTPMLEKHFNIKAKVSGGKKSLHGILKLQLCTDYACDRPREHPFEIRI